MEKLNERLVEVENEFNQLEKQRQDKIEEMRTIQQQINEFGIKLSELKGSWQELKRLSGEDSSIGEDSQDEEEEEDK